MPTLITGASGFVGLNIIEALLARGEDVVSLGPVAPPGEALACFADLPGQHRYLAGDVTDKDRIEEIFRQCQPSKVVHGAALTIAGDKEQDRMSDGVRVNILGTVHMLDAALNAGVERFVHLSSASVYGAASYGSTPLHENETVPEPESLYSVSKYAGERLALRYRNFGLDVRVPRLSAVFGAWEYATGVRDTLSGPYQATMLALAGQPAIMPREGPRDWVYSRDVAGAVLALLDHSGERPVMVNVAAGGDGWTTAAWCERLAAEFPAFSYRIDKAAAATISYHGPQDRQPLNIDRLTGELGYQPQFGLEAAFVDYMTWLRENKSLLRPDS